MKALRYQIELNGRVLAAGRGGDPNAVVTQPYLPGSLLRGVFIEQFFAHRRTTTAKPAIDLAADEETRHLFFNGDVRYLNGYLLDEDRAPAHRMLPTPRSWHSLKDTPQQVVDFAAAEPEMRPWSSPYRTLKKPFCTLPFPEDKERQDIWLAAPKRISKTHHQRPDAAERRDEETGDIYRYESLAAGQTFEAVVLCDAPAHAECLHEGMGDEWRNDGVELFVGKSRGVQGRVRLRLVSEWDTGQGGPWNEASTSLSMPRTEENGTLVVTLLSDVLARGEYGQFAAGPSAVTRALNRTLEAMGTATARFSQPVRTYMRPALTGGFNRAWGLRLPEADADAMGSVLVYENPGLETETLHELEWRGIGARREVGFGRIGFNLHGYRETFHIESEDARSKRLSEHYSAPDPLALKTKTKSHDLASRMAERMFRKQLDLALDVAVSCHSVKPAPQVPRSQVGGLRALVQRALAVPPQQGRVLVRDYLNDLDERHIARSRFAGVSVHVADDSTPLVEWIDERVKDGASSAVDASLWGVLLHGSDARPAVGTARAELTDRLTYVYNLRLVHDVLAQAGQNTPA